MHLMYLTQFYVTVAGLWVKGLDAVLGIINLVSFSILVWLLLVNQSRSICSLGLWTIG